MNRYLGRVNLVSIFSVLPDYVRHFAGDRLPFQVRRVIETAGGGTRRDLFIAFPVVSISFAAFLYFLIMYPSRTKGDNIKGLIYPAFCSRCLRPCRRIFVEDKAKKIRLI